MKNILEVRGLNKVYVTGKNHSQQVLRDIDLDIRAGEFVAVMGPSGSGKSTLLYNVSGMDRPTTGWVKLDGQELTALGEEALAALRLREMGFVFQQSNLLKNLSIMDNIILSAYLDGRESRAAINRRAQELMERTGIAQLADNDITQASGGQLQRAAICRALINAPRILFGDEPTGALNSRATLEVMDILAGIHADGTTILLVTHDAAVAARSERVLYMADGVLAGETVLGTYDPARADHKQRESQLRAWLQQMGF